MDNFNEFIKRYKLSYKYKVTEGELVRPLERYLKAYVSSFEEEWGISYPYTLKLRVSQVGLNKAKLDWPTLFLLRFPPNFDPDKQHTTKKIANHTHYATLELVPWPKEVTIKTFLDTNLKELFIKIKQDRQNIDWGSKWN